MRVGQQAPYYGPLFFPEASFPGTTAGFLAASGITPTALYTFNEASGSVLDKSGSANLAVVDAPTYRAVANGITGANFAAADDEVSADVNDPANASFIYGVVCSFPNGTTTTVGLVNRSNVVNQPFYGLYKTNAAATIELLVRDVVGVSASLSTTGIDCTTPVMPRLYMMQVDRTNTTIRLVVAEKKRVIFNGTVALGLVGSLTGGAAMAFGYGSVFFGTGGAQVALGFYATGSQCEGSGTLVSVANRLGWGR